MIVSTPFPWGEGVRVRTRPSPGSTNNTKESDHCQQTDVGRGVLVVGRLDGRRKPS